MAAVRAYILHRLSGCRWASSSSSYARLGNRLPSSSLEVVFWIAFLHRNIQMCATNALRRGIIVCAHPDKIHAKDRLKLIADHHNVSIVSQHDRQSLIADFQRLAAERSYHAILFFPGSIGAAGGYWDKELFTPFDKSLRLVAGSGSGYDHVDVEYLTKIGAYYANAPISVCEPTAMTTVSLILQTIRATTQAEMTLRKGQWTKGLEPTDDIRDLTIGW
ncbi:d-isomer specific 2-hydroxyacid dehydrogenase, catalytic domain-containing protein [Rhizoctonia solani AG-1 IA]|uniref:D-isomer specific 2-hydroxyacid dehydrogenase, catalytic domain-containing protein n=1 Tax=Thanatephorus cucumeris (strain AG1-IA) TaxID=983506 RepID=L8X6D9_THACA|nr:d-isomer specific 2-hydroxyacid dehydrogenase, catalytic domain-containing protein [Rhizoctonia solani AG-1 IA]